MSYGEAIRHAREQIDLRNEDKHPRPYADEVIEHWCTVPREPLERPHGTPLTQPVPGRSYCLSISTCCLRNFATLGAMTMLQ